MNHIRGGAYPDPHARQHNATEAACWRGELPAELLPPTVREELVCDLWLAGATDQQIAAFTFMTTYTTARIRQRLGLPPRLMEKDAA